MTEQGPQKQDGWARFTKGTQKKEVVERHDHPHTETCFIQTMKQSEKCVLNN